MNSMKALKTHQQLKENKSNYSTYDGFWMVTYIKFHSTMSTNKTSNE